MTSWCIVATAGVLLSCGGGSPSQSRQNGDQAGTEASINPGAVSPDGTGSQTGAVLPIADLLRASNDFASSLATLQAAKVNACMRAQGFDYQLSATSVMPDQLTEAEVLSRRYGAPQMRAADGVVGYAFDNHGGSPIPTEEPIANEAETKALIGEVIVTGRLDGVGGIAVGEVEIGNGCVGMSLAEIFGSVDSYVRFSQLQAFVDSISSSSLSRLYSDPIAIDASAAWSGCMRDAGFEYRTPFDVTNRDWESPRPGPLEQETARSDQSCRATTGVDQQLAMLDAAEQNKLLAGSTGVLVDLRAFYNRVIDQATA